MADALTTVQLHALHRLPDVRNALLDYADTPCDDTAHDLLKLVADHIDKLRNAGVLAVDPVEAAALVCEDMLPKNDRSDWTEYAKDKHAILTEAARRIRAVGVALPRPPQPVDEAECRKTCNVCWAGPGQEWKCAKAAAQAKKERK